MKSAVSAQAHCVENPTFAAEPKVKAGRAHSKEQVKFLQANQTSLNREDSYLRPCMRHRYLAAGMEGEITFSLALHPDSSGYIVMLSQIMVIQCAHHFFGAVGHYHPSSGVTPGPSSQSLHAWQLG